MTKNERAMIDTLYRDANALMDIPGSVNPVVRNIDVIEGLIGDLANLMNGRKPEHVAELLRRERVARA